MLNAVFWPYLLLLKEVAGSQGTPWWSWLAVLQVRTDLMLDNFDGIQLARLCGVRTEASRSIAYTALGGTDVDD